MGYTAHLPGFFATHCSVYPAGYMLGLLLLLLPQPLQLISSSATMQTPPAATVCAEQSFWLSVSGCVYCCAAGATPSWWFPQSPLWTSSSRQQPATAATPQRKPCSTSHSTMTTSTKRRHLNNSQALRARLLPASSIWTTGDGSRVSEQPTPSVWLHHGRFIAVVCLAGRHVVGVFGGPAAHAAGYRRQGWCNTSAAALFARAQSGQLYEA